MTLILNGTDNSATTPAVTGTDTDTGVYYPAANQVALATNGTLALIVDASRNIGLGATPSVSTLNGLVEGAYGNIGFTSALGVSIAGNAYYDSSWKYKVGSTATLHLQDSGGFKWFTAPSGSTGNAITFTQSLGLNKGTTLVLEGGASSSGTGIAFPATQSASTDANTLDDYEEGTIDGNGLGLAYGTAGTSSFTYSDRRGTYTKIGRVVYFTIDIRLASFSKGTASGELFVVGLPFAQRNTSGFDGARCTVQLYNWTYTTSPIIAVVTSATTTIAISRMVSNDVTAVINDPNGNSIIWVTGFYFV
jgi:hypothetical protein